MMINTRNSARVEILCAACGGSVTRYRSAMKQRSMTFCGPECRKKYTQEHTKIEVSCATCGVKILKYPGNVMANKTGRFYCSDVCRLTVRRKKKTLKISSLVTFAILMQSGDGIMGKSPSYIQEKFDEAQFRYPYPESLLDNSNKQIFEKWVKTWKKL